MDWNTAAENDSMETRPLSATDMYERDHPCNSLKPPSSESIAPSNGIGPNHAKNDADPGACGSGVGTTDLLPSTVDDLQKKIVGNQALSTIAKSVGVFSVKQKTVALRSNPEEFTAFNKAEVEQLREIENLHSSQDSLSKQIEALKKTLAEVTTAKVSDQGDHQQKKHVSTRTTPMTKSTAKRHFDSNFKLIRQRPRKISKHWRHSIRVIVLSFCALSWFHLHLLVTSNLPALETKLDESHSPSLRGATGALTLSKKMKSITKEVRWLEDEKAKKLALHDGQTVLCVVALGEEPYIDEWVDYHLGLGFGKIIVYDNTQGNELKHWGQSKGNAVEVIHYPGTNKQQPAYWDCAKTTLEGKYGKKTWVGFWDVDEFLVLKKHDNVDDFVGEYLTAGALGINWHMFGPSGLTLYQPLPVTKRFVCRQFKPNARVKSIAKLKDMNMEIAPHVHFPYLNEGTLHDTNGRSFEGPFNEDGPTDIAAINHYRTKSVKEFLGKTIRGRADVNDNSNLHKPKYDGRVNNVNNILNRVLAIDGEQKGVEICHNLTHDDSAWRAMKKIVPKYVVFDAFASGDQPPLPSNLENILLDLEFES